MGRGGGYTLTVRHGSDVAHERFDDLDEAVAALRRRAGEIEAEGPLPDRSMLRDFSAAQQVHARLEISGKGLLRAPTAGVDVRGDGSIVPFQGAIRREELKPRRNGDPFETVRAALGNTAGKRATPSPRFRREARPSAGASSCPPGPSPPSRSSSTESSRPREPTTTSGPERSSSATNSSRRRSAPAAGWRCTSASSAPTASTRPSTFSSCATARSNSSPTLRSSRTDPAAGPTAPPQDQPQGLGSSRSASGPTAPPRVLSHGPGYPLCASRCSGHRESMRHPRSRRLGPAKITERSKTLHMGSISTVR